MNNRWVAESVGGEMSLFLLLLFETCALDALWMSRRPLLLLLLPTYLTTYVQKKERIAPTVPVTLANGNCRLGARALRMRITNNRTRKAKPNSIHKHMHVKKNSSIFFSARYYCSRLVFYIYKRWGGGCLHSLVWGLPWRTAPSDSGYTAQQSQQQPEH